MCFLPPDGVDTQTDATATENTSMQTKDATLESSSMQTDKQSTGVRPTQTESNSTDAQLTQTDKAEVEESSMQTDEKKTKVLPTQTEIKSMNESFMQTDEKKFVDSVTQTDIKTFASFDDIQTEIMCFERFEQSCQASVLTKTSCCQTQVECYEQDCQTELEQVDSECQTFKDEQTRDTQTIIKEYAEMVIQTDSSMSLLVEQECQASVELYDGECQAVVQLAESEAQAVVDMLEGECQATVEVGEGECQAVVLQAEGACQATTDMMEGECQAVVEQIDGDSQVELFFSETECQASVEQLDGDCQTSVEQADKDCQAYPDGSEIESQTDASFWLLADNESQTEPEQREDLIPLTPVHGGRSVCMQTEAVRIKTKISQTDGICEDVPLEEEKTEEEKQQAADLPPPDLPPPDVPSDGQQQGDGPQMEIPPQGQIDPSMISIMNEPGVVGPDGQPIEEMPTIVSIEPVSKPDEPQPTIISIEPVKKEEKGEKGEIKEMACQTDPVTIIIGDASFLVSRLKDSSSQPARVSRNEIEIEVGPEADKKDLFNFDSKRNARRQIKQEPGRARQQPAKPRIKKEKVSGALMPELPVPQEPEPVQRLPPPGSDELGQYSCPFCALTFHESPALYEHLQVDHGNITSSSSKAKTPRSGGKGKSTRARKRPNPPPELEPSDMIEPIHGGEDQGPPILTPYREGEEYTEEAELAAQREQEERQMRMNQQQQKQRAADNIYKLPEDDGPGLFEDIPEPKPKKQRKPREIQQRNKSVFPPIKQVHSNIELDCPMCAEKFGTPDLLYLHIRRYHKEEDNSRKRIDVVNALMHDKLAETPELMPVPGSRRRRRLPMVAQDSTSDSPAKRRRTKEVIADFEESLIEDEGGPSSMVERVVPHEQEQLEADFQQDDDEQNVENLVERINPDEEIEEDQEEEHMEGEEEMPSDMLENMVEVVVQEPGEEQEEEETEEETYQEPEMDEELQASEDETAGLVEAIEDNGIEDDGEDSEEAVDPEIAAELEPEEEPEPQEEEELPKEKPTAGLRRTRHSLKGQGPPRSTPRTRGGRRH